MDSLFGPLLEGLGLLADPQIILLVFIGVMWGNVGGALPGMTSSLTMGVMVPFTFAMNPVEAIVFMVAINVGVSFGNSIPAILLGLPGTPSAVLTAIDGFALHKRGESGLALGASFFAAVTGQYFSTVLFLLLVVPLAQLAYSFLPPELFAMHLLGMAAIVSLTGKHILKGLLAAGLGLGVALVGRDPINLVPRFTFGQPELAAGLNVVPVVLGLLAVSELIRGFRQTYDWSALTETFSARFPRWPQIKRMIPAALGGTVVGTVVGAIPGVGGSAAAIISYQQAKLFSKHPEEFGEGSVEGIVANEAGQQASQAGELVPTFGFGIPGSGAMVLMLAALTMHGILPGPLMVQQNPGLLGSVVAGLIGATTLLLLLGWPITRMLLRVATLNRAAVLSVALGLTLVGVFSLNHSLFDVNVMLVFGLIGYVMLRYGYSTAGAAIAVVLGVGLERGLRQGLLLTGRDPIAFVSRPITATVLAVALLFVGYGAYQTYHSRRHPTTRPGETGTPHLPSEAGEDGGSDPPLAKTGPPGGL